MREGGKDRGGVSAFKENTFGRETEGRLWNNRKKKGEKALLQETRGGEPNRSDRKGLSAPLKGQKECTGEKKEGRLTRSSRGGWKAPEKTENSRRGLRS